MLPLVPTLCRGSHAPQRLPRTTLCTLGRIHVHLCPPPIFGYLLGSRRGKWPARAGPTNHLRLHCCYENHIGKLRLRLKPPFPPCRGHDKGVLRLLKRLREASKLTNSGLLYLYASQSPEHHTNVHSWHCLCKSLQQTLQNARCANPMDASCMLKCPLELLHGGLQI
jgi:hypothetical protein